jgi:hypothetical protein
MEDLSYLKHTTFGRLKKGDPIYVIAPEPFITEAEDIMQFVDNLPEGKTRKECYIVCRKLLASGIMVLPANEHVHKINDHLSFTADKNYFIEMVRPILEPRIKRMKEMLPLYEQMITPLAE